MNTSIRTAEEETELLVLPANGAQACQPKLHGCVIILQPPPKCLPPAHFLLPRLGSRVRDKSALGL